MPHSAKRFKCCRPKGPRQNHSDMWRDPHRQRVELPTCVSTQLTHCWQRLVTPATHPRHRKHTPSGCSFIS